jgi:hypothetical protein
LLNKSAHFESLTTSPQSIALFNDVESVVLLRISSYAFCADVILNKDRFANANRDNIEVNKIFLIVFILVIL